MPDQLRDANISRLFDKVDLVGSLVNSTLNKVDVINTKVDDFAYRLKKLEDKNDKALEREEKIELVMTRVETIIEEFENRIKELEEKVSELESVRIKDIEKDITIMKNNWIWIISLVSTVSGIIGGCISFLIDILIK